MVIQRNLVVQVWEIQNFEAYHKLLHHSGVWLSYKLELNFYIQVQVASAAEYVISIICHVERKRNCAIANSEISILGSLIFQSPIADMTKSLSCFMHFNHSKYRSLIHVFRQYSNCMDGRDNKECESRGVWDNLKSNQQNQHCVKETITAKICWFQKFKHSITELVQSQYSSFDKHRKFY